MTKYSKSTQTSSHVVPIFASLRFRNYLCAHPYARCTDCKQNYEWHIECIDLSMLFDNAQEREVATNEKTATTTRTEKKKNNIPSHISQ